MESNSEKTGECSIKIDSIWSEADENMLIKEEMVSDVEPEIINCTQDSTNDSVEHQIDPLLEDESSCNGINDSSVPSSEPLKKKMKTRSQKQDDTDVVVNHKLSCIHDTKNFKIIKRRLRCGDCKSLVCPECCKVMIPNLQGHFLGTGQSSSGTYLCKLCSIIFHSLCALQAHIRIHTLDTPYVCPDCGLIYNNLYFLILHLLNKCHHVYKIVRYKCKQCPGVHFTPDSFVQHIQENHIHCVYRCLYCSSLFSNYDEFNNHMENLHHKQKVQYLNYFRCSLCSNMVIPKFMYQRHVGQHRENSENYEVDYQCLCGETFNLIGAFRSHFSYCNKKGILPPKWSFLQKKLRTQDVFQEKIPSKELVVQPIHAYSKKDCSYQNRFLVKSDDRVLVSEEVSNEGISGKSNHGEAGNNTDSGIDGKDFCKRDNENSNGESGTSNDSCVNLVDPNEESLGEKSTCENSESGDPEISVINEKTNAQFGDKYSTDTLNNYVGVHNNDVTQEINNGNKNKESDEISGDIPKIYDHIPCDHLGYLIKKQCSEHLKTPSQGDDVIVEKSFSPKSFKIITQLDEKTGIITTKTAVFDETSIDEEEEIINENDRMMENPNFNPVAKQCNEKSKFKMDNSLSCPFCVVLFPKHNLTFQQFRLHLESYHPDAALNITINEDDFEPDKQSGIEAAKTITEGRNSMSDDQNSQSSNHNNSLPSRKEEVPQGTQNENPEQNSTSMDLVTQPKINNDGVTTSTLSNESEEGESSKASKSSEGLSPSDKNPDDVKEKKNQSWESEEIQVVNVSTHEDVNLSVDDFNKENTRHEDQPKANEEKCDFERSLENTESSKDVIIEGSFEKPIFENKASPKSLPDLDYEGETSKDSNWSELSGKESKSISPTDSRADDKERSRRESEVWSEFYESLMLAEKLKKRKNPSPDSDSKKKSVVSDYSSKRVVKKPKRYGESSESGNSNELSESEEELFENEFMDKIYSEEKGEIENQLSKRQILVNKLENVDGKFVDYLLDLVMKKEKLFELYKKHSTLRANRHNHDLRNYRKKVLNGIKQKGKPLKILRYHDLLKKKELMEDKSLKDNSLPKKKSEFSVENKGGERKRGRPRKPHDPAKLKERRRSDKEVDFIEKHFEREEIDVSPSKRKRKLSSKLQYYRKMSDEKDDFSSGQVITNKTLDVNKKFTCAVCKEVFPEQNEFREHIVTHRMEESTYQCMDCGECFVVRPSLEKHLHAFHKIKNTDKYITENECCNIKKDTMEEDNEPLKENQCKVCKDQFQRPIDLTKHFRIHGMAFLKEFRKEAKTAEKRNP